MNDGLRPCGHVRRQVSAAVLAVDDFTGQIIRGQGLQVLHAVTGKPAISKGDGYHIFVNCEEEVLPVVVQAPHYGREEVAVRPKSLDPLAPVVKVRLCPNRLYALPPGTTCVSGSAQPDSLVLLVHEDDPKPLKLLYDYDPKKSGECMSLFAGRQELDGRRFLIRMREGKEQDLFLVLSHREDGECRIDPAPRHSYKKAGAVIYPVYAARADAHGRFFLPIRSIAGEECGCRIWTDKEEKKAVSCTIVPGRETRVTLP